MKTRKEKREEAERRNGATCKLTPAQRLARLDERLGVNTGATRERARLIKLMEG